MTTREALHHLVDQLPEDQVDLARHWLEDLRDAADDDGVRLEVRQRKLDLELDLADPLTKSIQFAFDRGELLV